MQLDAEHPKAIPMDPSKSPSTPLGPMTQACARALETEVTSLLSHFHFDAHETWLLPHTDTLCMLRYHGEAKEQGEEEEEDGREDEDEEEESLQVPRLRTTDGHRTSNDLQAPDIRPPPDDRCSHTRDETYGFPEPLGRTMTPGRSTPTGRPTENHPSRNYGRPIGTRCPDPREPPDDR